MKLLSVFTVLASSAAIVFGQTIEIGYPKAGNTFHAGQKVVAQILRPDSIMGCTEVGIALATTSCSGGSCPQPSARLGSVLYAGPFNPTAHATGGFYQNFTVTIPDYMTKGPAIFTLTHLCLLGAGPYPFLEYRNASITIN